MKDTHSLLAATALLLACGGALQRPPEQSLSVAASHGAIWDDPVRCAEVVKGGRRLARAPDKVRVGTWNVRWFPDGRPGNAPEAAGTSIEWMACIIAHIDVDVLALQEIKLTARGREALGRLVHELRLYDDVEWRWAADTCPTPGVQHLVLLHRSDRVALEGIESHAAIDPTAGAERDDAVRGCSGRLRPALAAYVKSRRGGADFHFVTTHLDSGRTKRDFEHRRKAWDLVDAVSHERTARVADEDIVLAADFNLMGCAECGVATSRDELALWSDAAGALKRPLRVAPLDHPCTEYYRGHGYVIDQISVSSSMREANGAGAVVSGLCGATRCAVLDAETMLPLFDRISDHCPVVLDLADQDLD